MTRDETNLTTEKDLTEREATPLSFRPQRRHGRRVHRLALATAVFATGLTVVVIFHGIHSRTLAEARLQLATDQAAIPTVIVTHPQPATHPQEIVLPGNTQAFIDSPIYARTNGYLKRWCVDIGARVRRGDLLAEIEAPELDQQLREARAHLATAEANFNLSQITAERNENLLKTRSIATQERDNAVNANAAAKATVHSNQANVARLEQLQAFEKIFAPFDGVITARSTDVGALIDAGASAPKELFHIAAIQKLRVYIAIPEVDARVARPGTSADLTFDEYPGRTFQGTLVRSSNAIDYASRTLLAEVDVDNVKRELMPGSYVRVHLKLPTDAASVVIPSNAVLFRREGLQVGVVRNGTAELVHVTPGYDYGDSLEIVSGLRTADELILNPSDSLTSGTPVQISHAAAGGPQQ